MRMSSIAPYAAQQGANRGSPSRMHSLVLQHPSLQRCLHTLKYPQTPSPSESTSTPELWEHFGVIWGTWEPQQRTCDMCSSGVCAGSPEPLSWHQLTVPHHLPYGTPPHPCPTLWHPPSPLLHLPNKNPPDPNFKKPKRVPNSPKSAHQQRAPRAPQVPSALVATAQPPAASMRTRAASAHPALFTTTTSTHSSPKDSQHSHYSRRQRKTFNPTRASEPPPAASGYLAKRTSSSAPLTAQRSAPTAPTTALLSHTSTAQRLTLHPCSSLDHRACYDVMCDHVLASCLSGLYCSGPHSALDTNHHHLRRRRHPHCDGARARHPSTLWFCRRCHSHRSTCWFQGHSSINPGSGTTLSRRPVEVTDHRHHPWPPPHDANAGRRNDPTGMGRLD